MKKTMILTTLIAGILLGTICGGCGESDETKANIKAIAETQKAQAAAAARTETEKRRKIKEAHEFHLKQMEILRRHRSQPGVNPFAPDGTQTPVEEKQ
jgi:hypothetical protein